MPTTQNETTTIDIVFDGPPGPESGRFIETETVDGHGIGVGEWIDRGDGTWALRLPVATSAVRRPLNLADFTAHMRETQPQRDADTFKQRGIS